MNDKKIRIEELSGSIFGNNSAQASDNSTETLLLQSLTARLSAGDQSALEQLYLMYYDAIALFISRIVYTREDASDLAQEVFIYLWDNYEKLSGVRSIKGYIYSIARTKAFRFIRDRAQERGNTSLADYPMPHIEDISPDDIIIADETKLLVELALNRMSAQRRQVFELSRNEGLSHDEIAARLGITNKTVRNHLHAALSEIKELLMLAAFFLGTGLVN